MDHATSLPSLVMIDDPIRDYAKTLVDFRQQIMRSMMVPVELVRAEIASGFAHGIETRALERQERDAQAVEDWLIEEDVKTTGVLKSSFPGWATESGIWGYSINCRCSTVPIDAVDEDGNKVEAKLDLAGSIISSLAASMAAKEDALIMAREEHDAQEVEDWLVHTVGEVMIGPRHSIPMLKMDPVADIKNAVKELAEFPRVAKQTDDQLDAINAAFGPARRT